jgi:molecular chaperone DnaJ
MHRAMTTSETHSTATLYEVLGVSKDASGKALKKAYRTQALQLHPDKNPGDTTAATRFKAVSEAYNVLADADKRAFYDSTGSTEDIDVSAEDWMTHFATVVHEISGGMPIKV